MRKQKFSPLTLACLPILACGGGGGSNNKIMLTDAAGSNKVYKDAPPLEACQAKPSYSPTFGSNDNQQAFTGSNAMSPNLQYFGNITEASPIDLVDIELWIGSGGDFPTALATGTFDLSMKGDTDYNSCDSCVFVWPQVPLSGSGALMFGSNYFNVEQYMAKSGTLHLTSVTGNITGSLTNVALRQVNYDGSGNQTDDANGCTTTITALNFTAPITAGFVEQKDGWHMTLHNRHR